MQDKVMKPLKLKTCSDCGEDKPVIDFRRNDKMKDGRMSRCKKCERKREIGRDEKLNEYAKHFFVHDKYYS